MLDGPGIIAFLGHVRAGRQDAAWALLVQVGMDPVSAWNRLRRFAPTDPTLPTGYQALAYTLSHAGRLQEALNAALKSIEIGPSDADNWIFLGVTETRLGRYEKAQTHIDRALSLNPFKPVYYCTIAMANLYALDRFADAIDIAGGCLAAPKYAKCHWMLALNLAALGRLDEARAQIAETSNLLPNFDLEYARAATPYPVDESLTERYLEHLRVAGLGERNDPGGV